MLQIVRLDTNVIILWFLNQFYRDKVKFDEARMDVVHFLSLKDNDEENMVFKI